MFTFCFYIKPDFSIEEAWQELEEAGVELLFSSETPEGSKEIMGRLDPAISPEGLLQKLKSLSAIVPSELEEIDWQAQWAAHGLDFHDGFVHIELEKFGCPSSQLKNIKTLKLEAGPGFGDLSHPTTRLVLGMMVPFVSGAHVLDVGSGSGVLALCASAMGAQSVHGVDIDPNAVEHAQRNAELNGLEGMATFGLSSDYQKPEAAAKLLVLMNMISSEQQEAWQALEAIHDIPGDSIVSGILAEDRKAYLKQAKAWGWKLKDEAEEEGWLGLHFLRK